MLILQLDRLMPIARNTFELLSESLFLLSYWGWPFRHLRGVLLNFLLCLLSFWWLSGLSAYADFVLRCFLNKWLRIHWLCRSIWISLVISGIIDQLHKLDYNIAGDVQVFSFLKMLQKGGRFLQRRVSLTECRLQFCRTSKVEIVWFSGTWIWTSYDLSQSIQHLHGKRRYSIRLSVRGETWLHLSCGYLLVQTLNGSWQSLSTEGELLPFR